MGMHRDIGRCQGGAQVTQKALRPETEVPSHTGLGHSCTITTRVHLPEDDVLHTDLSVSQS